MKSIVYFIPFLILISCRSPEKFSESNDTYKDTLFTNLFKRETGWIAGDGAFSIPIKDGKSLWTFGDSYMDCYDTVSKSVPCLFQARNAVIRIDSKRPDIQETLRSSNKTSSFFAFGNNNKYWFWPQSGFQRKDTVYVFLSRLRTTGEQGMWGFAGVDTNYIAKLYGKSLEKISYGILKPKNGINFGNSLITNQKGFNYIYGIKSNGFGNDMFIARFRSEDMYGNWQYFDGSTWNDTITSIRKIHAEFTSSFYVVKIKMKYVLITTEFSVGCDQGKNIFVSVSDNPFGPFENKHSVWVVNDTLQGHYPFFYVSNAHPEFDNGRNEILITYCINGYGTCVNTCTDNRMNPDVYRPKAIRVPYNKIDADLK